MNRRQFLKALGITALAPVIPFESIRTVLAEKVIPPATLTPLTDLNLKYAFADYGNTVTFKTSEVIYRGDMVQIVDGLAKNAQERMNEIVYAELIKGEHDDQDIL